MPGCFSRSITLRPTFLYPANNWENGCLPQGHPSPEMSQRDWAEGVWQFQEGKTTEWKTCSSHADSWCLTSFHRISLTMFMLNVQQQLHICMFMEQPSILCLAFSFIFSITRAINHGPLLNSIMFKGPPLLCYIQGRNCHRAPHTNNISVWYLATHKSLFVCLFKKWFFYFIPLLLIGHEPSIQTSSANVDQKYMWPLKVKKKMTRKCVHEVNLRAP